MNARFAILGVGALMLAAGCQKVPEPKTATRASGEGSSVALPSSKAPQTSSGDSSGIGGGQAGGPSQQRPAGLSKQRE